MIEFWLYIFILDLFIFKQYSFQVEVTELNTQFIENIIFIMKYILEMKSDQPCEYLGVTSIESMMLSIVRLVFLFFF